MLAIFCIAIGTDSVRERSEPTLLGNKSGDNSEALPPALPHAMRVILDLF